MTLDGLGSDQIDTASEAFARRLATLLRESRKDSGRSLFSLSRASDGRFTRRDLRQFERAELALGAGVVWELAALYEVDLETILPARTPLVIDPVGLISAAGVTVAFDPEDTTAVLTSYLRLVRRLRDQRSEPMVDIRRADIDVLSAALGETGESIVDKLGSLMDATKTERKALVALFTMGAVVIGLSAGAAAIDTGGANSPSPAVDIGSGGGVEHIVPVEIAEAENEFASIEITEADDEEQVDTVGEDTVVEDTVVEENDAPDTPEPTEFPVTDDEADNGAEDDAAALDKAPGDGGEIAPTDTATDGDEAVDNEEIADDNEEVAGEDEPDDNEADDNEEPADEEPADDEAEADEEPADDEAEADDNEEIAGEDEPDDNEADDNEEIADEEPDDEEPADEEPDDNEEIAGEDEADDNEADDNEEIAGEDEADDNEADEESSDDDEVLDEPESTPSGVWRYSAITNSGANSMSFDGTTYKVGGQAVKGQYKTTDLNEFVRFVTSLYDEADVVRFGSINGDIDANQVKVLEKDDGTVRVSMGGRSIGGATVVDFDGKKASAWANQYADFLREIARNVS